VREKPACTPASTNKATNNNGGLRWIANGSGYYCECNKRLKG
jgi:hypothetical protein